MPYRRIHFIRGTGAFYFSLHYRTGVVLVRTTGTFLCISTMLSLGRQLELRIGRATRVL